MQFCKAFITGVAGTKLGDLEKAFIAEHKPWGFVLFARNIKDGRQLASLTESLIKASGRKKLPIFVDQEGGRVQRLRPPLAPLYPAAEKLGMLYAKAPKKGLRAAWLMSRLIACDLQKYGINGNFLPVLDVPVAGSNNIIGDRAYDGDPRHVAALGRAAICGLRDGGLFAVCKHIPGHGRAFTDTHKQPAKVDADKKTLRMHDFIPFKNLAYLPAAMTAHVIYEAYDCDHPATLSKTIINEVIRGEIGFDGLLISDDLSMQALSGSLAERAKSSIAAGCDVVLHCNGMMAEMQEVAQHSPILANKSLIRVEAFEKWHCPAKDINETVLRKEFATLMADYLV